jgi:hypothetical protein
MADYIKKRTHIVNHPKFLEAGAVARDLYDWGMLVSGAIESDGELTEAMVLSSPWGASGTKNRKVADRLVELGLWERTPLGWRILKWTEQGNVTKALLEEKRAAARERMRKRRGDAPSDSSPPPAPESPPASGAGVRANFARSSPEVRSSASGEVRTYTSPSTCEGSVTPVARARDDLEPPPKLGDPMPAKYRAHAKGVAMKKFPDFDADESWGRYVAWCIEQGTRPSEPRWWRWVSEDVERAKNRHVARSSGLRLLEPTPPAKAPYYAEWKPPEPDEEVDLEANREASRAALRALGVGS